MFEISEPLLELFEETMSKHVERANARRMIGVAYRTESYWEMVKALVDHQEWQTLDAFYQEYPRLFKGQDSGGNTFLTYAARKGELSSFKYLLEHGAEANAVNTIGRSVWWELFHIETSTALQMAQLLVDHGALNRVYLKDQAGNHFMSQCCTYPDPQGCPQTLFKFLLPHVDMNYQSDPTDARFGEELLWGTSYYHQAELVQLILDRGVDLHQHVNPKASPLLFSIVHRGCTSDTLKTFQVLLQGGADVNEPNEEGESVLMMAVQKGNARITEAFLQAGAKVDKRDRYNNGLVVLASDNAMVHLIPLFHQHGASLDEFSTLTLQTLMHFAVYEHDAEVVQYLLEQGQTPDSKDKFGVTPRDLALEKGYLDILSLMEQFDFQKKFELSSSSSFKVRL